MPITGLGTGGYGHDKAAYIKIAAAASSTQVRIDNADTYDDVDNVGSGMADSGVPRANVFLLTKTGSGMAMGYNDTLSQFDALLAAGGYTYVDAVLVHWPTSTAPSVEPTCQTGKPAYDEKACRLATWRAYVDIFNSGRALSIGVSNYNATHLQEIKDAGMPLPALNQIPYNIYRSSSWEQTVAWCRDNDVVVNAYSPFGVPDVQKYPTSTGMSSLLLEDPVLASIAAAHGRTPAQVISNWLWQLNIPLNPRTMSTAHMAENVNSFDFVLSGSEVSQLSSRPQDWCTVDPKWYECAP